MLAARHVSGVQAARLHPTWLSYAVEQGDAVVGEDIPILAVEGRQRVNVHPE